jgi:hypothetical protein
MAQKADSNAQKIDRSNKNDDPFDDSMLSHFRQRIGMELVNKINQIVQTFKRMSQKANQEHIGS